MNYVFCVFCATVFYDSIVDLLLSIFVNTKKHAQLLYAVCLSQEYQIEITAYVLFLFSVI